MEQNANALPKVTLGRAFAYCSMGNTPFVYKAFAI